MQIKSIAECSKGSILQYFRPSLSYQLLFRSLFCLFLSDRFTQVLLYFEIIIQICNKTYVRRLPGPDRLKGPRVLSNVSLHCPYNTLYQVMNLKPQSTFSIMLSNLLLYNVHPVTKLFTGLMYMSIRFNLPENIHPNFHLRAT